MTAFTSGGNNEWFIYEKYARWSRRVLIFINILAVLLVSLTYLFASKYIVRTGQSHSFMELLPSPPLPAVFSYCEYGQLFKPINNFCIAENNLIREKRLTFGWRSIRSGTHNGCICCDPICL